MEATITPGVRASVGGWRSHAAGLCVVVAALLALFARDARDVAAIWWTSSTYEHCLVILPIVGWLVWQRLPVLAEVRPRSWALPLLWVAAGAFGWLLGEAAGVAVVRHLALVVMIQGAVATLLGRGAVAALLFPLFYALFLVPAGDMLVPPLQTLTARICMVLLDVVHVRAHLDGVFITTPGGWFKVAEACSGAKFLIAMMALGVLVAHLGFRSWRRRAVFLLLAAVAPVLANGIRAFGTIWVAQYKGAAAAGSFDHIVYGWIFFAIVILIVLAIGWRFFDKPADAPPVDRSTVLAQAEKQRSALPLLVAALAVLAAAAVAPLWSAAAIRSGARPIPASAHLPEVAGWTRIAATDGTPWKPRFDGADRLLLARYRDAMGAEVDLAVALYATQERGRSLVGYGHGAVDPDGVWSWAANLPAPPGAQAERIVAPGAVSRTVLSFYTVGAMETGSAARVKLETLRHHLLGGSQRAAALLVSSEDRRGGRAAIERFLSALGPADKAIDQIAAGR
ncbi:exosortase A [Sphingomonas sp. PR090111-T3T-6A]|uniref:exosortase A n=1 Tax=Sphingomonas sp. PR090111-T3T-6A TaxID=685778 RepID=UPI0003A22458|nr:exosortase A [Sphingomonas sp. PR090111-T3T-6A]